MQVDEAIRSLRATRLYSSRPVEDGAVRRWVNAARWCGSSKNSQPWRFIAVRHRDSLRALSSLGEFTAHLAQCDIAVVLVATSAPYPFSLAFDLGRVAQCLMVLAHNDGVGSCVAVFGPQRNVVAAGALVRVPADWSAHLAIGFGYPTQEEPHDVSELSGVSPPGRLATADLLYWERFSETNTDALR
jgi:nitroreductase